MQATFDLLGWPEILAHLESRCQTGYGRLLVESDSLFLSTPGEAQATMALVEEVKILIQRFGDVSLQPPPDALPSLKKLEKQGVIHNPQELADLLNTLRELRTLFRFLIQNRAKETTPYLNDWLTTVTLPNTSIELIERVVSSDGAILPTASATLPQLQAQVQTLKGKVQQTLQQFLARPNILKMLQEPLITEREGRSVLPLKVEYKADLPGIVHGTSVTGSTLYVEPEAVIPLNNRLVQIQGEVEREIARILKSVSEAIAPEATELIRFVELGGQMDLVMAKARLSLALKANPVEIQAQKGVLHLRQVRHPLLVLQGSTVVPNDIFLQPPHQTILITGPNTGGKTVLLKLLGLFVLMARAGLHVPVAEGSSLFWFADVLADMGDPQSLAQSLSTFSGHMARLKQFLEHPELGNSLVLIDEICAGTDPQEGAVLAQAILQALIRKDATIVVTTHIGALKGFAHQRPEYLNASVEFDAETLSPTYRLILGVPGTSHALNIAARLGIPEEIISEARQELSQTSKDSIQLLESLESKNYQLNQELETAQRLREEIAWEEAQMRKQLNHLEGEKKRILQMFRDGLRHKLRGVEQEVDALKKSLKEVETPSNKAVQKLSKRFRRAQGRTGEIFTEETQQLYPNVDIQWQNLKVGDVIESRSLSLSGTIVDINPQRQEVTIQSGIFKTTLPWRDIVQKVSPESESSKQGIKSPRRKQGSQQRATSQASPRFLSLDCDVRGLNSDEAIGMMEKYLDDAMLQGVAAVHVIHGLGTGVLKKAIRQHLKELPYIKSFGPAAASDGGDGKTIVTL